MEDKTVIAIAHRLSTIARMDRPVVLEAGRIVQEGTHAESLALGGLYDKPRRHQSGGFLASDLGPQGNRDVGLAARAQTSTGKGLTAPAHGVGRTGRRVQGGRRAATPGGICPIAADSN
jgi:hypothetical protein